MQSSARRFVSARLARECEPYLNRVEMRDFCAISLNSIQNLAQKFKVFSRRDDRFFQPFAQFIFALVPLALGQLLMKHDAFFQFAASSPERPLQRFGVLPAKALRRKPMTDKTLEECEFALLNLVERSVAFRTRDGDLVAGGSPDA